MPKVTRILILILLLAVTLIATEVQAVAPKIDVLEVKGVITPVLVDYIERGIDQAEEDGAIVLIIQMDTPGGLDTSMRDIVRHIVSAKVPVVVYVSPSGSRAASAGVFITMAAHVAVMAPNTAIGAAHPVALEGEMPEDMEEKVVNDAAAYIRSIAGAHKRNMEWAERAVRESVSATEQEALALNVIDMVAPNLNILISQLDGRQVTMLDGSVLTLHTQGAAINHVKMSWVEGFLYAIADPTIATILLSLGMLGLVIEITTPGIGVPGIAGGICLILAFFSLGVLPVNYTGVILTVLAFGLFTAEVFTPTFGLLTVGGITSLIVGSLILFRGRYFQVNLWVIATIAIIIAALFAFVIQRAMRAHRRQATTGREELMGKSAIVKVALEPQGTILHAGELWTAILDEGRAELGEEVIITKFDGMKLYVTKKQ